MDIAATNRQIVAWSACDDARSIARKGSKSQRLIADAQDALYRAQNHLERGERTHAGYYARRAERDLIEARSLTQSLVLRVAIGQARDAATIYIRTIQA